MSRRQWRDIEMKPTIIKIVSLFIALGFLIANTEAQPVGEFKGSLVLAFFNEGSWHSNSFSVDLQSQPPHWHLVLKSPGWHKEMFVDSNHVEIVNYYDDVVPTKNGPNTAEIKLFPTSRPLGSPCEEVVWAALFSRDIFLGKKAPLNDIGLRIEEPCIFTEIQFKANDVSPRFAKWHNERADKYEHQPRIEGEFRRLVETNLLGGMVIPLKSELEINVVSTNGESIPASYSQLTIESITPLTSAPEETPTIKGRAPVYDYRFGGPFGRTYVTYDSHDGVIHETNNPTVLNARKATAEFRNEDKQANAKPHYIILGAFMVISIGFLAFAVATKKQQRKE
jgi:hypothetical protein